MHCIRTYRLYSLSYIYLILLFLGIVTPALADQNAVIEKIIQKQKAIKTLSAAFVQKKHSTMLKDPLVSEGDFHFKVPGKVAWIYAGQVEIISDGHELTVYYPQIKEAEIIPVQSSIMRLPLNFNLTELQQYFTIELTEQNDRYVVTLTPVDESSLFSKMVITLLQTGVPKTVEMFEKGGDRSLITFSDHKINKGLPDDIFIKKLPQDTVIRKIRQ